MMPTVWENSFVDKLQLRGRRNTEPVVDEVRRAIEPLIAPDQAKILVAIATDVMTAVQTRNQIADVEDACRALRAALALLQAVDGNLDG